MARTDEELSRRLLATFRVEAAEHLEAMSAGLMALEKNPSGSEADGIVETVFREIHSLKGAAGAVNLAPIESLCQSMESVLFALKKARLQASAALLDLLLDAVDQLGRLLADEAPVPSTVPPVVSAMIRRLDQAASGAPPVPDEATEATLESTTTASAGEAPAPPTFGPASGTIRVSTGKLDAVMRQVEELLSPRLAARQHARDLRDVAELLKAWRKTRARLQPALRRIERSATHGTGVDASTHRRRELIEMLEYLDREHLFLADMDERLSELGETAERDQRTLSGMTEALMSDMRELQLMPFSSLFDTLPRIARELSREQGKEVDLVLRGGEIELDRRMLEALKDPLVHLLRNAIDHGIEEPSRRAAAGKPARGTITLRVSQVDSGKLRLRVADDGVGIDGERLRAAAGRLGISAGEGTGREAIALAFRSGVTTSPMITDISGRGLGLAIVREKVESLGGDISVESTPAAGATFRIDLPLSLATFRGVLVRAGDLTCVVPSEGVERVARVAARDIRTTENRETIILDTRVVPLVALTDVLEIPRPVQSPDDNEPAPVLVLGRGDARIAFQVDEVLGEQEILAKNLGPQLTRVRNVAGASVLGTGHVVPVLNIVDLLKSASNPVAAPSRSVPAGNASPREKGSILVVEDSITTRSLLKGILEAAGYAVTTAVDGMDGYAILKTGAFDLVVSDVEMPRMDGFDLTARIRADKEFADLPVILVTALESREHRERGIDVGANAYIVKSGFDQGNLLEIVARFT